MSRDLFGNRSFRLYSLGGTTCLEICRYNYLRCFVVSVPSNRSLRNRTHEERLLDEIFQNYNKVARAAINVEQTVVVNVDFVLLRIHGLVGD